MRNKKFVYLNNIKLAKGITLIALIITIIVLVILAAVSVSVLYKTNMIQLSLKSTTDYAEKQVNESQQFDELETKISEAVDIINETNNLINGVKNEDIKITHDTTISEDYLSAIIRIEIVSNGELSNVTLDGKKIGFQEVNTNTFSTRGTERRYYIEEKVTKNKKYIIIAKDKENGYNIKEITIRDLMADMEIANKEELEHFRNMVNEGKEFEGKTIKLISDIDLGGNDNNIWVPIGDASKNISFKGTFDGDYHKIVNLYYRGNTNTHVGLFALNNGTIQNVILDNVNIYAISNVEGNSYVGGIAGESNGNLTNIGINSGVIIAENKTAISWRGVRVGGIVGIVEKGDIVACYNKANIEGRTSKDNVSQSEVGGIVGRVNVTETNISNCYNRGNLKSEGYFPLIGGISASISISSGANASISNSYNTGTLSSITGSQFNLVAGMCGVFSNESYNVSNCYDTSSVKPLYHYNNGSAYIIVEGGKVLVDNLKTYDTILGEAFTSDKQNENKDWKYNDGLPILEWQTKR